jgi:hypothetical protein
MTSFGVEPSSPGTGVNKRVRVYKKHVSKHAESGCMGFTPVSLPTATLRRTEAGLPTSIGALLLFYPPPPPLAAMYAT